MTAPQISVQLYSVRFELEKDFDGTIDRVAGLGLRNVEPFLFATDTDRHAAAYERNGLHAPSGHEELLGTDQDRIFDAAARLGIGMVIDNFLNPSGWDSVDDIARIADQLNRAAERGRGLGIQVGYHNHHWEVQFERDGRSGLELLADHLDPDVLLEVDTYWVAAGGADVPALLRSLGRRVKLAHLKDGPVAPHFEGQVPLGQGAMPLPAILDAAADLELGVIEFDQYAGDIFDGIGASARYLQSIGCEL
jgi:sugar phosphate isomerase/epimerase